MIAFASIALPVVIILFVFYLVKLGERMENERRQREVAEALLNEMKKDDDIKEKYGVELANKRKSVRELLQNIHSSD